MRSTCDFGQRETDSNATSHLAANLANELHKFINNRGFVITNHQINLFIAGWLLDNQCTIKKV